MSTNPDKQTNYFKLRSQGWNRTAAAKKVGIAYNTAKKLDGVQAPDGRATQRERVQQTLGEPIPYDDLSERAKRGFNDFAFFQRTYLGRIPIPWQVEAGERIVEMIESDEEKWAVINVAPGAGKALALDTPIATPSGWSTMKDLQIGDQVFDEKGQLCKVTWKSEVWYDHDCYEVRTDDGASIIANAAHEWPVRLGGYAGPTGTTNRWGRGGKSGPKPLSADGVHIHDTEFISRPRGKRPQLQVALPLEMPEAQLPIEPYVLGLWLGDGASNAPRITSHLDDQPFIRAEIERLGYSTSDTSVPITFSIGAGQKWSRDSFQSHLRLAGVLNNKHIPTPYLRASVGQRIALLQGLIDTDGHVSPTGHVEFCNTNKRLAEAVHDLVLSLGVKSSISEGRATIDGRDCGPKYRVCFYREDAARLPRKRELCRNGVRTPNRYLTATPVESVPTQCIEVDSPSHLYLAGDGLMVTHNSTVFTHDIPAWITVRNRAITGLLGSAVQNTAEKYIMRLKNTFERAVPMKADARLLKLGLAVDADATLAEDFGRFKTEGGIWAADQFVVAQHEGALTAEKEPTWSAFGRKGGVLGMRYQFVIWDDLVDPARLNSTDLVDEDREWYSDIAESRLEPGGTFILQGQRLGPNDLYGYALRMMITPDEIDEDADLDDLNSLGKIPKYEHVIYKAHYEEACQGNHKPSSPAYGEPGGCLLSPRRLRWTRLSSLMEERNSRFRVVYQQEDVDPESVLVQKEWVNGTGGHVGCWDKDRDRLEVPGTVDPKKCLSFVTVDPSPTQFWAIEWWLVDPNAVAGPTRYLIDLERRGMGANKFLDFIAAKQEYVGLAEDYQNLSYALGIPITHWIIEQNAAQRFMLQTDMIQNWQRKHGVRIIPHTTTAQNKNSQELGIQALLPGIWERGLVRLPGKNTVKNEKGRMVSLRLVDEVTQYPHSRTDDCVMSQWFGEIHLPELLRYQKRHDGEELHRQQRPSWFEGEMNALRNTAGLKKAPPRVTATQRMMALAAERMAS